MHINTMRYIFKSNKIVFFAISAILTFYMSTIMMMFDPHSVDAMMAYVAALPEAVVRALNFQISDFTFIGFLSGYYYGFLAMTFPLLFSMLFTYKALAKSIDDHSITHFLTSGKSRSAHLAQVLMTYGLCLLAMITFLVIASYVMANAMFDGEILDIRFLHINAYLFLFHAMMGLIMMSGSALMPSASSALSIIIGLPLLSMVLDMVSRLGDRFAWVRFLSLHSLFDADKIVLHQSITTEVIIMLVISCSVLVLTWIGFKRKDLIV